MGLVNARRKQFVCDGHLLCCKKQIFMIEFKQFKFVK